LANNYYVNFVLYSIIIFLNNWQIIQITFWSMASSFMVARMGGNSVLYINGFDFIKIWITLQAFALFHNPQFLFSQCGWENMLKLSPKESFLFNQTLFF